MLRNLADQLNLNENVLNPEPTLVEWSGGGSSKGAIFTVKTPVKVLLKKVVEAFSESVQ
jgi:hypothetical protein